MPPDNIPPQPVSEPQHEGMTDEGRSALVSVLLVWFYPIGLIFMFMWMKKWPTWAKVLIVLPLLTGTLTLILVFGVFGAAIFQAAKTPEFQQVMECTAQCETASDKEMCLQECVGGLPANMDYELDMDTSIDSNSTSVDYAAETACIEQCQTATDQDTCAAACMGIPTDFEENTPQPSTY